MGKFLVPMGEVGLSTPVVSVPKTFKTIKKWNCVVLLLSCSCFAVDVVVLGWHCCVPGLFVFAFFVFFLFVVVGTSCAFNA